MIEKEVQVGQVAARKKARRDGEVQPTGLNPLLLNLEKSHGFTRAAPIGMPNEQAPEAAAEWLHVIERQQLEIEALRQELAGGAPAPVARDCESLSSAGWPSPTRWSPTRRGSNASVASSAASLAFSVLSAADDAVPMNSERYARICEKMEKLRSALICKDAKLQKARARLSEGQRVEDRLRQANSELQTQLERQRIELAHERVTAQDAVGKAVDRAAQALLNSDRFVAEVAALKSSQNELRRELEIRSKAQHTTEVSRAAVQEELRLARQQTAQLTRDLEASHAEKEALQTKYQRIRQELEPLVRREYDWEAAKRQKLELQTRVDELQTRVAELETIAAKQADHITRQQECVHRLELERGQLQQTAAEERAEDQRHAAYLLRTNLALQDELQQEQKQGRQCSERAQELRETLHLQVEELQQLKIHKHAQVQTLQQRDDKYAELERAYRQLTRHAQDLERSQRQLVSTLVPTKKRLAYIQDALADLCAQLQSVSKTMATGRNREALLGRALREYGKRNRELQASVVAAKQQLRLVASAFRSSEKRKGQAVTANWSLKRDLVLERCQRTDLLQECRELEKCLESCQTSACETQSRVQGLEQENGVLQQAVTQLVAYAQELMGSQQSLQRELTQLEVSGARQQFIYG